MQESRLMFWSRTNTSPLGATHVSSGDSLQSGLYLGNVISVCWQNVSAACCCRLMTRPVWAYTTTTMYCIDALTQWQSKPASETHMTYYIDSFGLDSPRGLIKYGVVISGLFSTDVVWLDSIWGTSTSSLSNVKLASCLCATVWFGQCCLVYVHHMEILIFHIVSYSYLSVYPQATDFIQLLELLSIFLGELSIRHPYNSLLIAVELLINPFLFLFMRAKLRLL